MTRVRHTVLLAAASASAFACSQPSAPLPPAVLNRSGDIQLVCYDTAATDDDFLAVPLGCCNGAVPLATSVPACPVPVTTPVMHGLISQTGRGEIAAVDLDNSVVVDSNKLVPGYTFVDVGGLPRAIVVPKTAPGSDGASGPHWVFAAGAEFTAVQAVATCHFYRGQRCGPELLLDDDDLVTASRVILPGTPEDMVQSADGLALWVSLPDLGLLARLELSSDPAFPFALSEDGLTPREPTYFRVPVASVSGPLEISDEATVYEASCGIPPIESDPLVLPLAPRAEIDPTSVPEPTLLRVDEPTGLLFVADRSAPVLRAFRTDTADLTRVGEWGTGMPLIDFAFTAEVPVQAPDIDALVTGSDIAQASDGPFTRYLYALDSLGTLQAFSYGADADVPTLAAITPPEPSLRYRDRLNVRGSAVALDVIDTRPREPYLCGADAAMLDERLDAAKSALKKAEKGTDLARIADAQALVDALTLEQAISADSGPEYLRGVFLAVVSSEGVLDIVDVLDLDLSCRANLACDRNDTTLLSTASGASTQTLALRRHTERLESVGGTAAVVTVANEVLLAPLAACPTGYREVYPTGGTPLVCAPSDPWRAADQTWTVIYEDAITPIAGTSGMLNVADDGALWVDVPAGFDFCDRGMVEGDALWILSNPPQGSSADCPRPESNGGFRLKVVEAFRDRVRVEPVDSITSVSVLAACYPEVFSFEAHALGRFLVLSADFGYLHRITGDADGHCIADEARDARLESHLDVTSVADSQAPDFVVQPYVNPYIAFALEPTDTPSSVGVTVRITGQSVRVQKSIIDPSGRTDVSPKRVRYFPESPDLYVVDSASQGLRRFGFAPLSQLTAFR